jgi:hypothetical protein
MLGDEIMDRDVIGGIFFVLNISIFPFAFIVLLTIMENSHVRLKNQIIENEKIILKQHVYQCKQVYDLGSK